MKNFKLFALVAFALLSTNAFAAPGDGLTKGQKQTIGGIEYVVTGIYDTEDPDAEPAEINTVSAAMNNFTGTEIVIPATVSFDVEGDDDAGQPIKKVATFKVTTILDNGFKGLTSVTSLSIGKNVKTIGLSAFEGCENLSTVTFETGSELATIGVGAFAYTSIESIDFTACTKLVTFGNGAGSPFASVAHDTNIMLTEVVLPTQCTTVGASAFKGCTALSTISLVKVLTIGESAFEGCTALASAIIGTTATKAISAIGPNAFKGCTALASVEFGTLASAVVDDAAFTGCTSLATFSFNDITGKNAVGKKTTNSPYDLESVRTVNFKKYISKWEGYADGEFAVATGAFATNAFQVPVPAQGKFNNVYYNAETVVFPTKDKDFFQPFALDAFAALATADRTITLTTSLAQFTNAKGFATTADLLNKVNIASGYTEDFVIGAGTDKVLIQDKNNTSNYYYFANEGGDFSIAKNQKSGATVTVYQAYADVYREAAGPGDPDVVNIYFQPLAVIGGKYNIPAGETVILKSNQADGVEASPYDDVHYSTVTLDVAIQTELDYAPTAMSALAVKTDLLNDYFGDGKDNDLWFFNNPAKSGLGFTKYNPSVQKGLAAGAVFICTEKSTASARLNIVWLDADGNTTAIQKIEKSSADNGVIYNLAGQKVSNSYKGFVIKNGKKYIQK